MEFLKKSWKWVIGFISFFIGLVWFINSNTSKKVKKIKKDIKLNEKKTITIAKEEAYGDINNDLIQEVEKTQLPQDMTPEVGMGLVSKSPDGQEMNLLVVEVREESIVIDGNHPLAGKELIFDLEVVEIKDTEIIK